MTIEEEIVKRFTEIQKEKLEIHLGMACGFRHEKQQDDFKADKDIQLYLRYTNENSNTVWKEITKKAKNAKNEAMKVINKCKTQRQLAKWWMTVYQPACSNVHYDVYGQASNLCNKLFRYVRTSGYDPKNNQSVARLIFISYDEPKKPIDLKLMRRELDVWVEFIKPDADGWKKLSIMEPSLSASGSYVAFVKGEDMRLVHHRSIEDNIISDKIDKVLLYMANRFKETD